ncbi:MAG TPA: HIT family protein [Candidatus Saccharimonadales bacterium]|nr:HIT family protein [Candidatus Saccharimonadales bacterium]
MSEPSVYTKIINGEIPSHKIYEDDRTFAFLDIAPMQPGHTLIVPKMQVDRLEDLPEEDYNAVMTTVRKVMKRIMEVYGTEYRACIKVMGFDVPHAHVHVIPCRDGKEYQNFVPLTNEPDHDALAAVAEKLRF